MFKRKHTIHPLVLIISFAVICVAITVIILLAMGYRYVTNADGYKFFGKVEDGQPITGTIGYPSGGTAKLYYDKNTIEYANGDKYEGEILQLYRHGYGSMTYAATGNTYTGEFRYNEMYGYGTYTYTNGDIYSGNLINGKMDTRMLDENYTFVLDSNGEYVHIGNAEYTWADGSKYIGNFVNGLADGKGTFIFPSGEGSTVTKKYVGEYSNGAKHGQGIFYFDNGDIYEGEFVNDKRTGFGIYTWANGQIYKGNFIDGLFDTRLKDENGEFITNPDGSYKHGDQAVYSWPSGRTYTGYFEEGQIVVTD